MSMNKFKLFIKRTFDIIASLGGLIVLSPIMIICAILIRINLGSPIFFKQKRIGKDNKEFEMIKFRTMKDAVDKEGNQLPDELRLTKVGQILRSLSIDELPELINILKGDMSLIGPRPLLVKYLPLYNERQIRRHEVLPGLTGWAQVNGRNNLTWNEKFELDVYYVENWSLKLDLKIFFLTFYKVFKREGISQDGQATMEYFNGSN
ncbi:MAG: sugar transferase [Clostridium perfringens]|nr:sugar transferase [Clostridium perfringens]MDU5650033.1 sugar transferase [Clostridium perfringens]